MPAPSWDTIVIGSGAGGLTAAVALARAGQRVLVLEQHYLPGGWTHSFSLGGYTFSPGVHYLGELEPGGSLRHLFEGLGLGPHLAFHELAPDGYDHLLIAGGRHDVPKGRARHVAALARRFPRHRRALAAYFDACGGLVEELQRADELLRFPRVLAAPLRLPHLWRWGLRRLASLFDACGLDEPLVRAHLAARCGNHGLGPSEASAAAHAVMLDHYRRGAYYPCGGAKRIPRAFLKELRARGGAIRVRTRVARILVEGGRAAGVELASGERIGARHVVSNADAASTYETLLPPGCARRQRRRAARVRPSVSALSLFAAVDLDLPALGYDSGNYWWYRTADVDGIYRRMERELPLDRVDGLFVSISSLKDPHARRDGHHTLEMFTYAPHAAFARWAGGVSGQRAASYRALKRRLTDRMLEAAERVIPGLRRHLTFCELGTPLTNDFYCATRRGGCYGSAKTPWQLGPFAFSTRGPIAGLHLCGASTLSHGVAGAAFSGLCVARDVLGLRAPTDCLAPPDGSLRILPREAGAARGRGAG
jgi:phytoene dehydrogenase-like protein